MDEAANQPVSEPADDDIEQAYQKALSAMGDLPWTAETVVEAPPDLVPDTAEPPFPAPSEEQIQATPVPEASAPASSGSLPQPATTFERSRPQAVADDSPPVSPAQVVEATLFVGGMPLSAKKISSLLRGSLEASAIERIIDDLNAQYAAEDRPYEVRLGDGGYRLELRPEFEKFRNRVYGTGPREVRLSQDILEVLALVAYRQPIGQTDLEAHGKQNAGNLLRQLLRRDLVALERGDGGRKNVKYVTTPRFLSVFGLGSLAELPAPEDLARR